MTTKRYSVEGNWIKDNWIDKLLNIDFNTIDDAILCCDLLNDTEDKKLENGELCTQLLKENEQLKHRLAISEKANFVTALEKENEQLKKELHKLKLVNEMLSMDFSNSEHELWRENEQLKEQIADWETSFDKCKYEKDNLTEENEQLRHQIETYKSGNALLKKTLDKEWK